MRMRVQNIRHEIHFLLCVISELHCSFSSCKSSIVDIVILILKDVFISDKKLRYSKIGVKT